MQAKVKVFPHNDLMNLAYYHLKVIESKVESGSREALALDCMSCLVALAFCTEAFINMVGKKTVPNWREGRSFLEKVEDVCLKAGLTFSKREHEPYKTVWDIKKLRDSMAHGKPVELISEANTREELFDSMACPWDRNSTPEYVRAAYEQVKSFQELIFEGCKLRRADTLTHSINFTGR